MQNRLRIQPYSVGIPAGGDGSRFGGQDKGWVTFKGRALVEWTLDAVRGESDDIIISANRTLERYRELGPCVVEDHDGNPRQGPFAGMVRLLESARHEWLMCVPCDAAFLPVDLARQFAAVANAQGSNIVVLADSNRIHPTFCWLQTALASDARHQFDKGERSPGRWFARHRMGQVVGASPPNLNTPESLAALQCRS